MRLDRNKIFPVDIYSKHHVHTTQVLCTHTHTQGFMPAKTGAKGKGTDKFNEKRKKRRVESYNSYIYRVLKQVHPDTGISRQSMSVMNSFVNDMFERLMREAGATTRHMKKATLASRDVQTAVRLVLPGELAKHSVAEGTKTVTKYVASKSK